MNRIGLNAADPKNLHIDANSLNIDSGSCFSNSEFPVEVQSSSLTQMGYLWSYTLMQLVNAELPAVFWQAANGNGIDQRIKQIQRNIPAIHLLRSWCEGDEEEQHETLEYLKRTLDEDRLSDRKLFS
jgi:hypothetical protein